MRSHPATFLLFLFCTCLLPARAQDEVWRGSAPNPCGRRGCGCVNCSSDESRSRASSNGSSHREHDSSYWDKNDEEEAKAEKKAQRQDFKFSFKKAKNLIAYGNYSEAEVVWRDHLERYPDDPDGYDNLGALLERLGKLEDAIAMFRAAEAKTSIPPGDAFAVVHLVDIFKNQGRYSEAADQLNLLFWYDSIIRKTSIYRELGWLRFKAGDYKEAEKVLVDAIGVNNRDALSHFYLAEVLCNLNRSSDGILEFRKAIQLDPKWVAALDTLGFVLLDQGAYKEAESFFKRSLSIRKDNPDAHNNLGRALLVQSRLEEAEASFREAMRLAPHQVAYPTNLGSSLFQQGRYEDAEAAYRQALAVDARYTPSSVGLGQTLYYERRFHSAELRLRQTLNVAPDDFFVVSRLAEFLCSRERCGEGEALIRGYYPKTADTHVQLANMLSAQRQFTAAESELRAAIAMDAKNGYAYNMLGIRLYDDSRTEEAEAAYRKALEIDPHFVEASFNLGNLLYKRGDHAAAETAYRHVIEVNPFDAAALNNLSDLFLNEGKLSDAEELARRAIQLSPKHYVMHTTLGEIQEKRGNVEEAVKEYKAALELEPSAELVRQHLENILAAKGVRAPSLLSQAVQLRGDLKLAQNALKQVMRSIPLDQVEREEWVKDNEEAAGDAWQQGKETLVGGLLGSLGRQLDRQLKSANAEIDRAVTELAGEADPQRRDRLHAAIKLLEQQKSEIKEAQARVVKRTEDAVEAAKTVNWAKKDSSDLEKSLEGIEHIMEIALNDETIQKALGISKVYGQILTYGKSLVDSGYDISVELVAINQVNSLDRNSEAYLTAVRRLSQRIETTVQKLKAVEQKIENESHS